jgi:hypothetical protein
MVVMACWTFWKGREDSFSTMAVVPWNCWPSNVNMDMSLYKLHGNFRLNFKQFLGNSKVDSNWKRNQREREYIERTEGGPVGVEAAVVVLHKGFGNRLQIVGHIDFLLSITVSKDVYI